MCALKEALEVDLEVEAVLEVEVVLEVEGEVE